MCVGWCGKAYILANMYIVLVWPCDPLCRTRDWTLVALGNLHSAAWHLLDTTYSRRNPTSANAPDCTKVDTPGVRAGDRKKGGRGAMRKAAYRTEGGKRLSEGHAR